MSERERGYCDGSCVANGTECESFKAVTMSSQEAPAGVTKEDRKSAAEALREFGSVVDGWVETGSRRYGTRLHPRLQDVAEAIADARSQAHAEVNRLQREAVVSCAEVTRLQTELAEARGAQSSAAELTRLRELVARLKSDLELSRSARTMLAADMNRLANGEAVVLDIADRVRHRIDLLRQRNVELENELAELKSQAAVTDEQLAADLMFLRTLVRPGRAGDQAISRIEAALAVREKQ